jgi:hypothetical protein
MVNPFNAEIIDSLKRIQDHVRRWSSVGTFTSTDKKEEKKYLGIHIISHDKYPALAHNPDRGVYSVMDGTTLQNPYKSQENPTEKYETFFYGELIEKEESLKYLGDIYDHYNDEDFVFLICDDIPADGDTEKSYAQTIKEWLLSQEKISIKNKRNGVARGTTTYIGGNNRRYEGD